MDAFKGINNFLKIHNLCSCPQCEEKRESSLKLDEKNINNVSENNKYTHPFKKAKLVKNVILNNIYIYYTLYRHVARITQLSLTLDSLT